MNHLLCARGYEQVFHKHFLSILFFVGPATLAVHYQTAATIYERGGYRARARWCNLMARIWSCLDLKAILLMMLPKQLKLFLGRHWQFWVCTGSTARSICRAELGLSGTGVARRLPQRAPKDPVCSSQSDNFERFWGRSVHRILYLDHCGEWWKSCCSS